MESSSADGGRGGSVREGGGAPGLVVDADDLPGPLLPPAVEEVRLPLLLYGHGRPVQHWGNTTAKIALAVSAWCSENCSGQNVSGKKEWN